MKLDYYSSSLVIVGGWNPNIINPHWIGNHLLGPMNPNDPNQENINIDIDIRMTTTSSLRYAPIAMSFNDVKITFTDDKLNFSLTKGDNFSLLEEFALKICNCLPHTPVTAYDVNFVFTDEKISEDLVNIIDIVPSKNFDIPLIFEKYGFGLNLDGIRTNINIEVDNNNNRSNLKFNFHFDIDDLSKFVSGIHEKPMHILKEKAIKIMSEVYGLRLED